MKPMKVEGRTPVKLKRTNGAKREFIVLSVSLGLAACVPLLDTYIVRELLLFVTCAALLVFFAANVALLGILFHAAARSLLQFVREPKTRIAQQEEACAEQLVGPFVVSPTMSAAARTGRL
jgi:hypothetical protein